MQLKYKILIGVIIIIIVSIISFFTQTGWVLLFYSTIIAIFPNEIKDFCQGVLGNNQVRISYSYIFRIVIHGDYFLVHDEQRRNSYHPVGGVYKYDPDKIDISEQFGGIYDNVHDATEDTQYDLRLLISKNKLKKFNRWFDTMDGRENIKDLTREFKEELIDRAILSNEFFSTIRYKYIGSHVTKTYNKELRMKEIKRFDVFDMKLTKAQKSKIQSLMKKNSTDYVFATSDQLRNQKINFGGKNYNISNHSSLIDVNTDKLKKLIDDCSEYKVKIKLSADSKTIK